MSLGVELVVILGALLGDTPHTRPVPVSGVTSDPDPARRMDLEETKYEGPTGIVGVLQEACTRRGRPGGPRCGAAVPHYVSQPPNPKATLALAQPAGGPPVPAIPQGELPEDARAGRWVWTSWPPEDSEVAEYVQTLRRPGTPPGCRRRRVRRSPVSSSGICGGGT